MKKLIICLFLLFISFLLLSSVDAATKYVDICHGGDLKHKTTWEVKLAGKYYEGIVKRNGKYYKKYLHNYERSISGCKHPSHQKYNLMQGQPKDTPYEYVTQGIYGIKSKPTYSYKLMKQKTTNKINFNKNWRNYAIKPLGKRDTIVLYYSGNVDKQWSKNTMYVKLGYKLASGPDDDNARDHKMIKASVTFTKNQNGKILTQTKTFTPHKKWDHIMFNPKNNYKPQFARITYAY